MLIAATTATVEKVHYLIKFVKNDLFSTMRKDRSNGLMLFDIHKDLVLDYEIIINLFANKYQRKMLMVHLLEQLME